MKEKKCWMNRYLRFWSALLLWFGLCYIIVLVIGSQTEVNQSCLMMCRSLAWLVKGCEWGESVSHCRGVSHPEKGRVSVQGNLRHPLSLDCCTQHTFVFLSFYWFLFFNTDLKIFFCPDPKLDPHRAFCIFTFFIKALFSMFIRLFSMWGRLPDRWYYRFYYPCGTFGSHKQTKPHRHTHTPYKDQKEYVSQQDKHWWSLVLLSTCASDYVFCKSLLFQKKYI